MSKRVFMPLRNPYTRHDKFIGKLKNMLLFIDGDIKEDQTVVFTLYHGKSNSVGRHEQIAELVLSLEYYDNAYHVDIIRVNSRYQGFYIAPKLYVYIMKKFKIILQAGSSQSLGGRKLWAKLANTKNVLVFGTRGRKFQELEVDEDTGELFLPGVNVYSEDCSKFKTFACYQG